MTSKIKVLDNNLVNLIAAGEIIERPNSVAKELLDNSLDAGARNISLEIKKGGKKGISVLDDGIGMTRDDAILSLERHATSKLKIVSDLNEIHTLGFRGEALPSIASVSRFGLLTREASSDAGTEIKVEGGTKKYVRDIGLPIGTKVVVDDLFFSVPARRKFLKADKTEYYHILDTVNRAALSRPDVRFRLVKDGIESINTLPGTLKERAGDILGKRIAKNMGWVEFDTDEIRVTGLLGDPEDTRSNRNSIFLFVNDRFVKDYVISAAILRAYKGLMFKARYPIVVLFLQVPLREVDVNIHPTKIQVKFRETQKINSIVFEAVRNGLKEITKAKIIYHRPGRPALSPENQAETHYSIQKSGIPPPHTGKEASPPHAAEIANQIKVHYYGEGETGEARLPYHPPPVEKHFDREVPVYQEAPKKWEGDRILGQLENTYIVLAGDDGLTIIDQHAAHERVIYEGLKEGIKSKDIPRQVLLFPLKLELSPQEREIILGNIEKISRAGIDISDFGGDTVIVSSIPAVIKDADVKEIITTISEELKSEKSVRGGVADAIDRVITVMACHGAVRAGREMDKKEMVALIKSMEKTPHSHRCPHGRPTMISIPINELERRFKRTN